MSETFDEWAILELMGRRKMAGKVSEAVIAGGAFVRIDVPGADGDVATQFYAPGAIFCITPTTEELARRFASGCRPEPVTRWELPERVEPTPESQPLADPPSLDDDDDPRPF